jgi:hypothetical protein
LTAAALVGSKPDKVYSPPLERHTFMFSRLPRTQRKEEWMRKMPAAIAALGILGAATLASAAGPTVTTTGKIKFVDMLRHTVTLENGSTYSVARGFNMRGVKAGDRVTLKFTDSGAIIEASAGESTTD